LSTPLLNTKLYIPPTRPKLVPRPRLIEQLSEGLHRKLTLISAPAGFGKTTLVTEWLQAIGKASPPIAIAWLSLDKGDSDLVRFLTYFIAALNQIEGFKTIVGKGVISLLQSPQPPPIESVLTPLINEIATIPDRIILVLDDYHLIDSQPIHDALSFILENIPLQMHLVIATREDPHLPLARLRARGQLTELRAADLRFSSSEAAEFLNQVMGLALSADNVAALETRTEGWIAGLKLAAISLQGHKDTSSLIKSFTGSHRLVLDYLIEEVLDKQSESVQTFLLQTAILDRLTGSLCNALTGQGNGRQTLENLEQANLFIVPLDNERRWYRYHHLFADLLRQRLRQTQPNQLPILHLKASEWYKNNGFSYESVAHAFLGKNFEQAASLIENQFCGKYESIDQTILRRWLLEMPEELIISRPDLCILQTWNLFTSGQLKAADQSLQLAEKMLSPNNDYEITSSRDQNLPDNYRMRLLGRGSAIRSFIASFTGDITGTIEYARQALEYLPEQELEWRSVTLIALGDIYASKGQMVEAHKVRSDALRTAKASGDSHNLMIVNLSLAETQRQQGNLQQVIDICKRQLKRAEDSRISESAVIGRLLGIWGEVLAELNDLDTALNKAEKGVKLAAQGRDVFYIGYSILSLIRVLFSMGDLAGAEDIIKSMQNTAYDYDLPQWALIQFSAWQVRIWLAQGKLELASQWVEERDLDLDGEPAYLREMEHIALARIFIAQRKLAEADRLLQRLIETAEAGGRTSRMIEILILQALAFQLGGDNDRAMTTLEIALTLAEPEGFIRIFVDEGPPMARLLYEAISREIAPEYVQRLLAAFPIDEPEQAANSELIEPLSEREIEILQLVAEGLTNLEIASRLYLSPNTVKAHTRNIYGKLGVNNRTQAGVRARALGLLSITQMP